MKAGRITVGMIAAAICFSLTGCKAKNNENTQAGMQSIKDHQYEEALEYFDAAEIAGENGRLIARGRGIANLGMTDYEKAVEYLEAAFQYSSFLPDDMDYDLNYYLADAYERLGESQKALDIYDHILSLRQDEINALFLRGRLLLQTGRYDEAVNDFEKAVSLEKNQYEFRLRIAGALSQSGYLEEGQKYLSDFLSENEKKLSDYDKGRIYYYLNDFENAKICLERAKTDDSQNTIFLLGKSYEQLGDYNYAISVYKNYLSEHTDAAVIYNQLGLCKLQSGDYQEALAAFQNAALVENNGMEQVIEFNQIVAYEYKGDFKQAAVRMQAYLQKYPDDENAVREYTFLTSR